jgi:hypothetical protein
MPTTFNYTGAVQTYKAPIDGFYQLECWGAQGGHKSGNGAKGGYASGIIYLTKDEILYVYVGACPNINTIWNGGGSSTYSGGDASDIRRGGQTLYDRIIVAGGGGGTGYGPGGTFNYIGGVGGGLVGGDGQGPSWYQGHGGNQTAGGLRGSRLNSWPNVQSGDFGVGGTAVGNYNGGGGGGGWYGGGSGSCGDSEDGGGGGGSSFVGSLLYSNTIAGANTGNGKVVISVSEQVFFLIKDGYNYIPSSKFFNATTKKFFALDYSTIQSEFLYSFNSNGPVDFIKPFTVDSVTYNPRDIIDFSKCKIGVMTIKDLKSLTLKYTPSEKALTKTNIKIKEQYKVSAISTKFGVYLDIVAADKSKIDYFLDYGQAKSYKSSSILNTEMISNSFYANFKLDRPESLLSSVTLYNKYYYKKLQESQMGVYDNFKDSAFVVFYDDYDLMLVNRIAKKELINYIETLDKF